MPEKQTRQIAEVVIPIPVDNPFSYLIPPEFEELIQPGVQVVVPFGERYLAGIVLAIRDMAEKVAYELKSIHDITDPEPFVIADIMKLLEWIANYYICHLGEAYRLINPAANLHQSRLELKKNTPEVPVELSYALKELWEALDEKDWTPLKKLQRALGKKNLLYRVHQLKKRQLIDTRYTTPRSRQVYKTIDMFGVKKARHWSEAARKKYLDNHAKRYRKAVELINYLQQFGISPRQSLKKADFSSALIKRLEQEGVIERHQKEVFRIQQLVFKEENRIVELSAEQQRFVEQVSPLIGKNHRYRTFLLHGITGSGKTQIYIELIRQVLAEGRQAIVLIPEIILTPQTMARFRVHFGEQVAMIHSRLSAAEKLEVLQKIRQDKFRIVIGPRSAIFAPLKHLGLIVVDEEHESSYKQTDALPRYHARDVALYRAQLNEIPIVLGSATPSFESLYNARENKYEYYYLSRRISSRNLPRTHLVDLKTEWRRTGAMQLFSENLLLKLESRLLCREQAILLQNRRGFAPYIQCKDCGFTVICPNCEITLTYHLHGKDLRCHYCGYVEPAPDVCPQCKGWDILYKGHGTQKIEEEARERFPYARLLRMDQDTTRRKDDHANILERFRKGRADFLIGTKMIAKGLDFDRVTLTGIVNADQGLHFPDFRAAEKVFQLLVQAAGRAGRGLHSGEVVIQTYDPNHYIFKYLMTHDYLKFYEREKETRNHLNYPPYSRLCLIRVLGAAEEKVVHFAKEITAYLWKANQEKKFTVLGPAPAPLIRLNNLFRYHILIKQSRKSDPSMHYVRYILREGLYKNPELKKWPVEIQIDVDPLEIL